MSADGNHRVRDRRKIETRRALEIAGSRLFRERGIEETSVADVASRAGVSTRTFYRYFRTKADLLSASAEDHLEVLLADLASRPASETSFEALKAALIELSVRLEQDMAERRGQRLATITRAIASGHRLPRERWVRSIAAELASRRGDEQPDLCLCVLASTAFSALSLCMREWIARKGAGSSLSDEVERRLEEVEAWPRERPRSRSRGRQRRGSTPRRARHAA